MSIGVLLQTLSLLRSSSTCLLFESSLLTCLSTSLLSHDRVSTHELSVQPEEFSVLPSSLRLKLFFRKMRSSNQFVSAFRYRLQVSVFCSSFEHLRLTWQCDDVNYMRWKKGTSRIILASLPSFCKNYQNWWKIDKVLTKTNLHSFLRHGADFSSFKMSLLNIHF